MENMSFKYIVGIGIPALFAGLFAGLATRLYTLWNAPLIAGSVSLVVYILLLVAGIQLSSDAS